MGSSPTTGTKHRGTRWVPLCLVMLYGTRSRGKQNGPVERFARPGSESSLGAQHGVQAKDDLSGESHHRHQTQRHPLGASVFGYVVRDSKPGETKRSCGAFCPAGERKQSGRAARSASKGRFERRVPPLAPNQYNPNQIFLIGDGFGLFVFFEKFEDTHFRNGVVKRPESKIKVPRKL